MILIDNLQKVREQAARYDGVVLIAATKTQSKATVDEFVALAPEFILGENRVQELQQKYDERYRWHFIGQLQTNKVKYIIDKVELIHSLDRDELAREIEKQAAKHDKIQDCLIEVNMGAEISKGGVEPNSVNSFISSLAQYKHIRIRGIMSVLPNVETDKLHPMYDSLYAVFESAKQIVQDNVDIKYLSAGMSNDYEIALAHGANMIRLGRTIFGERIYPQNAVADK